MLGGAAARQGTTSRLGCINFASLKAAAVSNMKPRWIARRIAPLGQRKEDCEPKSNRGD